MSDLVQEVVNGRVTKNTATTSTSNKITQRGSTDLGEDAFLKLLVCEMQNQDPLEPTSNTEWIAQLASFSQLEEMQALSKTSERSQIYSLIGKRVILATEDANGKTNMYSGKVDFVNTSGSETKFSVNGELYTMKDLYSIVDEDFLYEKSKPFVVEKNELKFNGNEPEDLLFKVNFGEDIAKANDLAILIGSTAIPSDYIVVSGENVTLKKELFDQLEVGKYEFSVVFDDRNYTTVNGMLTVDVYNSHPVKEEKEPEDDKAKLKAESEADDAKAAEKAAEEKAKADAEAAREEAEAREEAARAYEAYEAEMAAERAAKEAEKASKTIKTEGGDNKDNAVAEGTAKTEEGSESENSKKNEGTPNTEVDQKPENITNPQNGSGKDENTSVEPVTGGEETKNVTA